MSNSYRIKPGKAHEDLSFFSRIFLAGIKDEAKFIAYWEKVRSRGKASFTLRHGILFALMVGAGSQLSLIMMKKWLADYNSTDIFGEEYMIGLLTALPLYLAGGYWYGRVLWKQYELAYGRLKNI